MTQDRHLETLWTNDTAFTDDDRVFGRPVVINVARDRERWADIAAHLSQWSICPERFEPVPPMTFAGLPQTMKSPYVSSLALTHAAICRRFLLDSKSQFLLIMEDDCRFLMDPRQVLHKIVGHLGDKPWTAISLGTYAFEHQGKRSPLPDTPGQLVLDQPQDWFPWGTHAYVVSRHRLEKFIGQLSSLLMPADHVLIEQFRKRESYLLRPSIAYQEEYGTYAAVNASRSTIRTADLPQKVIDTILANDKKLRLQRNLDVPIERASSLTLYSLKCRAECHDDQVAIKSIASHPLADLRMSHPPDLILDCNAGIGVLSAYLLTLFPAAEVLALEPDSEKFSLLCENLAPYSRRAQSVMGSLALGDDQYAQNSESNCNSLSYEALLQIGGKSHICMLKINANTLRTAIESQANLSWLSKMRAVLVEIQSDSQLDTAIGSLFSLIPVQEFGYRIFGNYIIAQRESAV